MAGYLLVEISDRIATLTLNRPDRRNALNRRLLGELWSAVGAADEDPDVDVLILTGSDPAFCAGMDLNELTGRARDTDPPENDIGHPRDPRPPFRFFPIIDKPIIGAINGPAATAGLEMALQCTFLVASERARFADTHARVGVMPGAGMSVLLPRSVGVRRALELSLTGNFIDADDALRAGLVNHVVPHDKLLAAARSIAADIAGNDTEAIRQLLTHARQVERLATLDEAFQLEAGLHESWQRADDPDDRRAAVIARGRDQTSR